MNYSTLKFNVQNTIAEVSLNQPAKLNALDKKAWEELGEVFEKCKKDNNVRVIILSGEGKHFCSGIDLSLLRGIQEEVKDTCPAASREKLREIILNLQSPINAIENCSKPVLSAIHGGCIGAGLDIIAACDMRYGTSDCYFTIKEIDMAMVADLGSLQRLPRLMPEGTVRELAFTGRKLLAEEAHNLGLINGVYESREVMLSEVRKVAEMIARKSPLAIRGSKMVLNHSRENTIQQGLEYVATWNAGMLMSADLKEALQAFLEKRPPSF